MEWHPALKQTDLDDGQMRSVTIGDRVVVLAKADGRFWAFDDICSHRHCSLSDGFLEGRVVECPCHGAQFDIESGAVLKLPATKPIGTYRVKSENNELMVEI